MWSELRLTLCTLIRTNLEKLTSTDSIRARALLWPSNVIIYLGVLPCL